MAETRTDDITQIIWDLPTVTPDAPDPNRGLRRAGAAVLWVMAFGLADIMAWVGWTLWQVHS